MLIPTTMGAMVWAMVAMDSATGAMVLAMEAMVWDTEATAMEAMDWATEAMVLAMEDMVDTVATMASVMLMLSPLPLLIPTTTEAMVWDIEAMGMEAMDWDTEAMVWDMEAM